MSEKFELPSGCKYEIIDGELYSLNWAERGMSGCSLGKRLPSIVASQVLKEWNKHKLACGDKESAEQKQTQSARKTRSNPAGKIKVKLKIKK